MNPSETWRPVVGCVGYEVSDQGRVRSFVRGDEPRELSQFAANEYGHLAVNITVDGVCKHRRVSRLVAEAFIPNPENKPEVAHGVGGRTDNSAGNLRWTTHAENMADRITHGTNNPGALAAGAVLSEDQVREIKRTYVPRKVSQSFLAKRYGVTQTCIQAIVSGRNWRHVK